MDIFIGVLALIASAIIAYKAYYKKDISLLGSVVSRLSFVILSVYMYIKGINWELNELMLIGGIVIASILATDIIVNTVFFFTQSYRKYLDNTRALEVLGEIQNKYYLILETMQSGIYVIDKEGDFEYVNPALCKLLGYSKEELLRRDVFDIVVPEQHEQIRQNIKNRISGKVPFASYNAKIRTKNGEELTVHIISNRTENGHPTITGNVIVVQEG